MSDTPKRIYLQWEEYTGDDVTWCIDEINPTDVMYIRKDIVNTLLQGCLNAMMSYQYGNGSSELATEYKKKIEEFIGI